VGGDPSSSLFGGSVGTGYRGAAWVGPGHGGAGVAGGVAATVFPGAGRIGFRRCRAERSGAAGPVPVDAATVLAERVAWTGSASWFRKQVALLRPEYAPQDPADRLSYRPRDQAQCDLWFPPARIPVGGGQACSPPVLVVVACFSRCITARMLPSRTTSDLLAGIWWLLEQQLGAVLRRLVWDNEAGIGRGGHLADGVAESVKSFV
jgi:hypothetical protein